MIQDDWFLSALSMLAAAGGVGDGGVDEQIARLFVHRLDPLDGSRKYDSTVGAFAVRLFKNGQWETVIVDDHFPIVPDDTSGLKKPLSSGPSRGAAGAHSKEMDECWVSLLEKVNEPQTENELP